MYNSSKTGNTYTKVKNFKEENSMRNDRRIDRRRDTGSKRTDQGGLGIKGTLLIAGIILILGVISFFVTVVIYNKNLEKLYEDLDTQELGEKIVEGTAVDRTAEASSQIGKGIEEMEQEIQEVSTENEDVQEVATNEVSTNKEEDKPNVTETKKEETENTTKNEVKEPVFIAPVEGELMKEFANDKLVYSETLKEWVTHTGVDIKADKTTVVKASEDGKVTAIKNDPRYGITVIIEHANGYETRYANLLTAEFINVGENVTKEQTIGTVGNTATFEILDECHLHFEILQNGEYKDPVFFFEI